MQFALGQQTQGGTPYSQIHDLGNNYHTITLPQIERDVLLEEDSYSSLGTPYRYGYIHKGSYSPENYGIWKKTVDGGMMWQIRFTSKDAYAISFEFEEYTEIMLPVLIASSSSFNISNSGCIILYP